METPRDEPKKAEPIRLKWCPEHVDTPDGCPFCEWLSRRFCGCPDGLFCLRCNRVSMMATLQNRGQSL